MHELDDIVGAVDIAELLGVSPAAVANWRTRYNDFPAPLLMVSRGTPLWSRREVLAWAAANGRLGGQG